MANGTETPNIHELLSEIATLREAADPLEEVYLHIGPYSGSISYMDEPWRKVRNFFDFDDSE